MRVGTSKSATPPTPRDDRGFVVLNREMSAVAIAATMQLQPNTPAIAKTIAALVAIDVAITTGRCSKPTAEVISHPCLSLYAIEDAAQGRQKIDDVHRIVC